MSDLHFSLHKRLEPPAPGWELSSIAIDDWGHSICLWRSGGGLAVTRSDDDAPMRLNIDAVRYPTVAGMLDGAVLVTGTPPRSDSHNARDRCWIVDSDGEPIVDGTLGHGTQHVLTTPSGEIWVGYSDTGVYSGNTVGRHGLVRFGPDLEPQWKFPIGDLGSIDDCYALNVFGDTATTCSYRLFDIVQVRRTAASRWIGAPTGAHGLIVDGASCVLVGGYGEESKRVSHLRFNGGLVENLATGVTTGLPPVVSGWKRICRGPEMHVIIGLDWFRASLG